MNWKEGLLKFPRGEPATHDGSHEQGDKPNKEAAAASKDELLQGIPQEYQDLAKVFSEMSSNELPPHWPTDCTIEIVPGAKQSKPKLYSMIPKELEELHAFIDKNLARGFIQPARPKVAAPVLFQEKKGKERWVSLLVH